MRELVPSLVHLEAPSFTPIELERFSPYFERSNEFGIELLGPLPHYRFLYSLAPEALNNLAYDFEYRYSDGRDPEAYTRELAEAVERWSELKERAAGSLFYRRGPGFLLVQDRRPGLEAADYRFDGIEAKIYLACDSGTTAAQISRQLVTESDNSIDEVEIDHYLQELVEAKLMYREGNSFLSLAVAVSSAEGPSTIKTKETVNSSLPVMVSR
jgi:hypothetical protein